MATTSPCIAKARAFHVMAKPIGPICNLDCRYCFYLEKEAFYAPGENWCMPEPVLEQYIRQYIQSQDTPEITFAWQGGEPTLMGVDFFRKVVQLQQQYADGKHIANTIQTNGTLLDEQWAAFLAEEQFLVGLSLDGPQELHDHYRLNKRQQPTFAAVMRGLELLKKHKAQFNTLTVVNNINSRKPLEVYHFLKQIGSDFIQFIPLVERKPVRDELVVTPWSVEPTQYDEFLIRIFDEWVREDVGRIFVQLFDVALGCWAGVGSSLCVFAERCGNAMALEHNGDVYSCDHYVYPQYRLGNLMERPLQELAGSAQQARFGNDKQETLPQYCRQCRFLFACNGECPKHRFARTPNGEPGLNYLCPSYKRFFSHITPYMQIMADLLRAKQSPAQIMGMLATTRKEGHVQSS